jgi:hypothetical protein
MQSEFHFQGAPELYIIGFPEEQEHTEPVKEAVFLPLKPCKYASGGICYPMLTTLSSLPH